MDYLLDTNARIALINGEPPALRTRLQKASATAGLAWQDWSKPYQRHGKDQPRSGERMQPTACPEPVEGAQAVGKQVRTPTSPEGAKDNSAAQLLKGHKRKAEARKPGNASV